MENYTKGKNVDEPLELSSVPIKNLPENIVWMKVKPNSKMSNLIGFALNSLQEQKIQLWTGIGPAVSKTISCVEIVKRRNKNLHQITKIKYHQTEEYWEPKIEQLDTLKVIRNVPVVHILLSTEPLDSNEPGYQGPIVGSRWKNEVQDNISKRKRSNISTSKRNCDSRHKSIAKST